MFSFGLVTEGATDQVVIENILYGVFNDPDICINRLHPVPDESGNWDKVFKYCASEEFKEALNYNDFLIVQVDTDVLTGGDIPKKYNLNFAPNLIPEDIIKKVSEFLISLIGGESDFWKLYNDKIIFAISVNQIECWLLPIYFKDQKVKRKKASGCISTLNEVMEQKEGFYIDKKEHYFYSQMSKHFKRNIEKLYKLNPSLKVFVERIMNIKEKESESI